MKMLRTFAIPLLVAAIAMSVSAIGASAAAGPLIVTKTANASAVLPGGSVTYTITVRNSGDTTATGVTLTDTLNGNLAFSSAGTISPTVTAGAGGTTILTFAVGDITPGATVTIPITATVNAGITADTTVNNTATATSTNAGTGTSNTVGILIGPAGPSITITKTPTGATMNAGGTITYNVTVRNIGGVAAAGVMATDTLDATTSFVSATPTPTSTVGNVLTYAIGALNPNQSFTFTEQARVNAGVAAGTSVNNSVRITGTNFDPVTASSVVTVVAGSPTPTPSASVTPTPSVSRTPTPSPTAGRVLFNGNNLPTTGLGTWLVIILIGLLILTLWPLLGSRTTRIAHRDDVV